MSDKAMFTADQLVSSTQLVKRLSFYLDEALKNPLFIQRDQKVNWVMLSLDEYEQLLRNTLH